MILFRTILEVESHVVKKNSKQSFFSPKTGRSWVKRSDKAIAAQNYLEAALTSERRRQLNNATIDGDIQITLLFRFKDFYTKTMSRNKKLPDLDNLLCLPLDALSKSQVILDDSNVCSVDGSRRLPGPKNTIEIIIQDFK